ncbi:MAG: ribose-phosphate pyrophosphokinase [Actinobacteria bacterium RBG_16_68_21]|nr:MAG: ribose-phosphate pyrophosphokinase [Actinobacteria bacterium RBG_16_68_21]
MEAQNRKRLMLFSGSANPILAQEVSELLEVELGGVELGTFADGEISARFTSSVRGADCFVLQSHSNPINFHIMEQLIMIDALQRASAKRITAVVPYFGYARQDKKSMPREPITARLMADLFDTAGADRLVSVDLHSPQIQGFTRKPFDSLTALPIFTQYLATLEGPLTVVSPDSGRVKQASRYARHLDAEVAFVHKRRRVDVADDVSALQVVGEVEGRHCVIVDDIIGTAGTIVSAAELLKDRGALAVRALATHALLSPPAIDRIKNAPLEETVVTNTLPVSEEAAGLPNLTILSIAPLLADTLKAIFMDTSVSQIFMGENV